jgi:N utilization substance protein B
VDVEVRDFAEALVRGTKLHEEKIDELISQYAQHWELERMAVVDRNILREGIFEILWAGDVPPKVAINEALEVAKKFSTQESSRFINGILDRIHKELRPSG